MASAAMPVPLVGLHQTELLQTHVAMLEQMHREAASAALFAKYRARAEALEKTQELKAAPRVHAAPTPGASVGP